jgi:hypothetical protein
MLNHLPSRTPRQRGVGTLAVSMLLLFASSIVVFYLNRGLIFEQKTAANQTRSTSAFEAAEAGIEWATGMLNGGVDIDTNCNFLSTALSTFRKKYLLTDATSTAFIPSTNVFPGCKMNGTALTCSCPNPGAGEQVASLGTAVLPSFTVAFSRVPLLDPATGAVVLDAGGATVFDRTAIRVVSTGCTAQAGACKPDTTAAGGSAATTGASDASARVEVVLKLSPTLRAAPSSALTCGTFCNVGGSYDIKNTEVSSNGYLVNAGTTISASPGTGYETIPGQPIQNALIANDESLSALSSTDTTCSASKMFQAYFGTTLEAYAASTGVKTISCSSAEDCGAKIHTAYLDGWRDFYFPDGISLNNSAPFTVLGENKAGEGVKIVSPKGFHFNGNITINGLMFSNSADFNDVGTGTADINGAIITCGGYKNNGNGFLNYSSAAIGGEARAPGAMVRVPGSWRDFQ